MLTNKKECGGDNTENYRSARLTINSPNQVSKTNEGGDNTENYQSAGTHYKQSQYKCK